MRICIDPGHGGDDPGARSTGINEKDLNLAVAQELQVMLSHSGEIDSVLTRSSDETLMLAPRAARANETGADLLVSIHFNADPDDDGANDPEAEGKEIWIYPGSDLGRQLAESIEHSFRQEFPDEPFRGIKERGLYMLRKTTMPAVLVELAFIDNSESNRQLRLPATRRQLAFSLMRGILAYHDADPGQ